MRGNPFWRAVRNAVFALVGITCTPPNPQASYAAPPPVAGPERIATHGPTPASNDVASEESLEALQSYIKRSWSTLRRSNTNLLQAAIDPKRPPENGKWPVYISAQENLKNVEKDLQLSLPLADLAKLELRPLTQRAPHAHGILYLPHPYVVPGGRFNEMYGWDSYFILLGLLRDNEVSLALDMTNNFLYEVMYYGTVLNANRTYFLTRSQPPLLTGMVLAVYNRTHDKAWLRAAVPAIEKYYSYWLSKPHMTESGLSRYYDSGTGPAPEVVTGETDSTGQGAYDRVREYYRTHAIPDYDVSLFYDAKKNQLTDLFFIGDRSMRESGFDPSERFGPFNAAVIYYNPVCLNSLLYVMERETADIYAELGEREQEGSWRKRAAERASLVNKLNWDEKTGWYFDYNFVNGTRRDYPFGTTFFPLWAGIATAEQAARVAANLGALEAPGGLKTSPKVTGDQWDAPYGWAPLQLIAAQGLRRYGFNDDANRISINFLSMLLKDFIAHNAIFEKYDVVNRRSDVQSGLRFGYTSNEIGFGWTNGTFSVLYADLPRSERAKVRRLGGVGVGASLRPARKP